MYCILQTINCLLSDRKSYYEMKKQFGWIFAIAIYSEGFLCRKHYDIRKQKLKRKGTYFNFNRIFKETGV